MSDLFIKHHNLSSPFNWNKLSVDLVLSCDDFFLAGIVTELLSQHLLATLQVSK